MTLTRNHPHLRRALRMPVAALLCTITIGGCATPAAPPPGTRPAVVSLASSAPSGRPAPPTGSDAGRPRLRMDMSGVEVATFWEAYNVCLHAHGVKENKRRAAAAGTNGETGLVLDQSGEPKSAYVACAAKMPLQPVELDEDKNPHYAGQYNDYIQCLRQHRLYVHALPEQGGWTWDDGVDQPLDEEQAHMVDKTCERTSFHVA